MIHATIQLLLYALLAGFSPLAFAATIAVMQAGRLKTLGFGTGFVLGQVFTCSLFVIVGVAVTGASKRTHSALLATLEFSSHSSSSSSPSGSGEHLRSRRKARASARRRDRAAPPNAFPDDFDCWLPPRDWRPETSAAHCACRHGDHHRRRWRRGEAALVVWYCALATSWSGDRSSSTCSSETEPSGS